jgi:beta-galactosidase GanA
MKYVKIFIGCLLTLLVVAIVAERHLPFAKNPQFIPTFSSAQANYLGLNPQEVYNNILNDFKPKHIRLQANWNELETKSGQFDFSGLDWQVQAAQARGISITLAVGRKLPRWPECHDPDWLKNKKSWEVDEYIEKLLIATIDHYKTNSAVTRWQLENEPLFSYGNCPSPNIHRLKWEFNTLKQLDSTRPVLITDSGELSSWWEVAGVGDELGSTLYRVTWNPFFSYQTYPWPPYFYRLKAALVSPWVNKIIVSELQMEPWGPQGLRSLSLSEARQSFDIKKFNDNVNFFKRTGLSQAFLWGVEWWYKAKTDGDSSYWEAGKELFRNPQPYPPTGG